jgi:hypothetical protein
MKGTKYIRGDYLRGDYVKPGTQEDHIAAGRTPVGVRGGPRFNRRSLYSFADEQEGP